MDDWDPIPLSRLSQAGYCLRRAALLTNEQLWAESADTAKGRSEHERVHTQRIERRGNSAKLYEFPVFPGSWGSPENATASRRREMPRAAEFRRWTFRSDCTR